MRNRFSPKLLGLAALAVLAVAGCARTEVMSEARMDGHSAYLGGDYKGARDIFASEMQRYPDDIYPQYNLAVAYTALGDHDHAIPLYRKVAANGKGVFPGHLHEYDDGLTFNQAACRHLKDQHVADGNCQ